MPVKIKPAKDPLGLGLGRWQTFNPNGREENAGKKCKENTARRVHGDQCTTATPVPTSLNRSNRQPTTDSSPVKQPYRRWGAGSHTLPRPPPAAALQSPC